MADIKFSALPVASALAGTEIVPLVQGGASKRTTAQAIANLAPVQDHGVLAGLADDDHPQYHNDSRGDARYSQLGHTHANATGATPGFLSTSDKTKLDGIAAGATANSTDAALRDRATHTGVQAISTVTGLQTALDALAFSGASVYKNTSSAYTVGGVNVYTPNTEIVDIGNWWTAGAPTKLVVPAGVGYAQVGAAITLTMSGTAREVNVLLAIKKNGTMIAQSTDRVPPGLQVATYSGVITARIDTGPISVAAADEFTLEITFQDIPNLGFNMATLGSSSTEKFWARRIG